MDLQRYSTATELVLARLPADVQPLRSARIKSPTDGLLTLRLPAPGVGLPEGAIWGEFDPERLQLESEAVALARVLFAEKETPKLRLDLARSAAELAERRAELDRQAGMLTRIAEDPSLAELYATDSSAAGARAPGKAEIAAIAARLRAQLALIDEVLLYAGTPRENELERRSLEIKLKAQEIDVARRLDEFRLAMPFAGEVSLIPPRPPAGKPLRLPLGADLALIQDFSAIQALVPVRRAEWRILDASLLQLRYSHLGRRPIIADFQRTLVKETLGREDLFYIFQFPENQRAEARPLAGGQIMMELVLKLDQSARIIPKIDLVLLAPEIFRDQGWDAGVASLIPGARILAAGETHLAVAIGASAETAGKP